MGGGASIEIKHTHQSFVHVTDSHFHELLSSKKAREHLFSDIAKFPVGGKVDRKDCITLEKLAAYFTDNSHALYPGFHVNVDTLNAAFKYTIEKFKQRQSTKKKKDAPKKTTAKGEPKLTKAMFHGFLPTLLLFVRVWDVFSAADKLVVEDQRVFKGEFMRIKEKLNHVHGIVILGETSEEEWETEFALLDKNNDRFITFEEMCSYALNHIKRPFDYTPEDDDQLLEEDDEEDEEGAAAEPSFVEVIGKSVVKLAPEPAAGEGSDAEHELLKVETVVSLLDEEFAVSEAVEGGAGEVVEAAAEEAVAVDAEAEPSEGAIMFV